MVKTIGNPFSWLARETAAAGGHVADAAADVVQHDNSVPVVQKIGTADLRAALRSGARDFAAFRSDVIAICILYPVIGLALAWFAFHSNALHLIFPLIAGFALLGPIAGIVLYEMSRRHEAGQSTDWASGFAVLGSPALGPILVMAAYLAALFIAWMLAAAQIYRFTMGPEAPQSIGQFYADLFGTGAGWALIVIGTLVGFVFAVAALAVSVVSFPMIVDRHVGVLTAITTSVRVCRENPVTVALWGLLIAVLLVLGSIPALVGLIVVLPILGHATWHLYRRAVRWQPDGLRGTTRRRVPGAAAPGKGGAPGKTSAAKAPKASSA